MSEKRPDINKSHSRFVQRGYPLLWFTILALLVFGRSIGFDYTYLDDQTLILGKFDQLRELSFLKTAFTEDVFQSGTAGGFYYRPMLTVTFMLDALIGNGSFMIFHLSNLLYHALATFLLFLLFTEMGFERVRAFLFTLLFLVHPMITQAVAWVPGRNDSILAIFILASFISWLKFLHTQKYRYLVYHLFLYLLALLTKESAVVLPLLILIYGFAIRKTGIKRYAFALPAWIILTLIWMVIRHQAIGSSADASWYARLFSIFPNLPALSAFLGKMFFPVNLSVYPILADMTFSIFSGLAALVILMTFIFLTKSKAWSWYFFGFSWFVLFLAPSFITITGMTPNFSEHRGYLSLMGVMIIILMCDPVKKQNFLRPFPLVIMTFMVLLFSLVTFIHTANYRNSIAFWQNAIETSPTHAFNQNNMGAMYYLAGDLVKAEDHFRRAIQLNPEEPKANCNLGLICMNTERPAEAEKYYLKEISINPRYDLVYYNLGMLYGRYSRFEEAISMWNKTLEINPSYADAYQALLQTYEHLNRMDDYRRIATMAGKIAK